MKEISILLDVDGVLADTTASVIEMFRELTGIEISREQVDDMPLIRTISKFSDEPEIIKSKLDSMLGLEGLCSSIPPLSQAQEAVEKLMSDPKIQVRIVTAQFTPGKTWTYERQNWLKKHFGIQDEKIYFAKEKHIIHGNIFIDDAPNNVREWKDYNSKEIGLLMNQPHNKKYQNHFANDETLQNWNQLFELIEKLKEKDD